MMQEKPRIGALIISYHDADAVNRLCMALTAQSYKLAAVLVLDNSATPIDVHDENLCFPLEVRHFPENLGVAGALIFGWRWATERGIDWLWVFDQDSVPTDTALAKLVAAIEELPVSAGHLGLVAPAIFHGATTEQLPGYDWDGLRFSAARHWSTSAAYECDAVISSGSLVNVKATRAEDWPSPKFFIDGVDFAFCYNLRQRGLSIFVIPQAVILHRLGEPKFVKLPFLKKPRPYFHLSPLRVFCICRNYSFLELKYSKWPFKPLVYLLRAKHCLYFMIGALFSSEHKLQIMWMALLGTMLGFMGEKHWPLKPRIAG